MVFGLDDTMLDLEAWLFRKLELTWRKGRAVLANRSAFLFMPFQTIKENNRAGLLGVIVKCSV